MQQCTHPAEFGIWLQQFHLLGKSPSSSSQRGRSVSERISLRTIYFTFNSAFSKITTESAQEQRRRFATFAFLLIFVEGGNRLRATKPVKSSAESIPTLKNRELIH